MCHRVEKLLNLARILLKIIVHVITLILFASSITYCTHGMLIKAMPLLAVCAVVYYCVIKDHSEDYMRKKFREWGYESLCIITAYLIVLNILLLGIIISAKIN